MFDRFDDRGVLPVLLALKAGARCEVTVLLDCSARQVADAHPSAHIVSMSSQLVLGRHWRAGCSRRQPKQVRCYLRPLPPVRPALPV